MNGCGDLMRMVMILRLLSISKKSEPNSRPLMQSNHLFRQYGVWATNGAKDNFDSQAAASNDHLDFDA
ncbi:hypothetical protein D3C74_369490 [compost metagenome]